VFSAGNTRLGWGLIAMIEKSMGGTRASISSSGVWAQRVLAFMGETSFVALACLSVVVWAGFLEFGLGFGGGWYPAAFIAYWLALLGALWLWSPGRFRTTTFVLTLCAWAFPWLVPFSDTTRFLADLRKVTPGMTEAQAEQVMAGYLRGTGWPADPEIDRVIPMTEVASGQSLNTFATADGELGIQDALVYRFSTEPQHNSSWGIVHLRDGRVARVDFWPD
jgi:hypothetical protein